MTEECTFCRSDVTCHRPVYVSESSDDERVDVGQFCNYACLVAHVEEEGLQDGACCHLNLT